MAHSQWMVDTDTSGTQRDLLMSIIYWRGAEGITCKELTEHPFASPSLRNSRSASAALTNAYADGSIARLRQEKRFNNGVYVHRDYILGRETKPYKPNHTRIWTEHELEFCRRVLEEMDGKSGNYYESTLIGLAKKILAEASK
jgi:hypothetical protein